MSILKNIKLSFSCKTNKKEKIFCKGETFLQCEAEAMLPNSWEQFILMQMSGTF